MVYTAAFTCFLARPGVAAVVIILIVFVSARGRAALDNVYIVVDSNPRIGIIHQPGSENPVSLSSHIVS